MTHLRQTFQWNDENPVFDSNRKNYSNVLRENIQLTNRKSSPYKFEKSKEGNIQYSNAKESHVGSDLLPKLILTVSWRFYNFRLFTTEN